MITWFVKNIVVGTMAKSINWSEKHIIDGAVNGSVPLSRTLFHAFGKTHSSQVSNQSGAMVLGVLLLIITLFVGSLS